MKVLSYEDFCKSRANDLKEYRKRMGITRDKAGEILFGKDYHVIDNLEHVDVKSAYRSEYAKYIYQMVWAESVMTGKDPAELFQTLEFFDLDLCFS